MDSTRLTGTHREQLLLTCPVKGWNILMSEWTGFEVELWEAGKLVEAARWSGRGSAGKAWVLTCYSYMSYSVLHKWCYKAQTLEVTKKQLIQLHSQGC